MAIKAVPNEGDDFGEADPGGAEPGEEEAHTRHGGRIIKEKGERGEREGSGGVLVRVAVVEHTAEEQEGYCGADKVDVDPP